MCCEYQSVHRRPIHIPPYPASTVTAFSHSKVMTLKRTRAFSPYTKDKKTRIGTSLDRGGKYKRKKESHLGGER